MSIKNAQSRNGKSNDASSQNTYSVGDLVWAKLATFPWYPSLVCSHPLEGAYIKPFSSRSPNVMKIHVQFFDDSKSRSWIVDKNIKPFCPGSEINEGHFTKPVTNAVNQATKAHGLSISARLKLVVSVSDASKVSIESESESEHSDPETVRSVLNEPNSSNNAFCKKCKVKCKTKAEWKLHIQCNVPQITKELICSPDRPTISNKSPVISQDKTTSATQVISKTPTLVLTKAATPAIVPLDKLEVILEDIGKSVIRNSNDGLKDISPINNSTTRIYKKRPFVTYNAEDPLYKPFEESRLPPVDDCIPVDGEIVFRCKLCTFVSVFTLPRDDAKAEAMDHYRRHHPDLNFSADPFKKIDISDLKDDNSYLDNLVTIIEVDQTGVNHLIRCNLCILSLVCNNADTVKQTLFHYAEFHALAFPEHPKVRLLNYRMRFIIQCNFCKSSFQHFVPYFDHLKLSHKTFFSVHPFNYLKPSGFRAPDVKFQDKVLMTFTCSICSMGMPSGYLLVAHLVSCHFGHVATAVPVKTGFNQTAWCCHDCPFIAETPFSLNKHRVRTHNSPDTYLPYKVGDLCLARFRGRLFYAAKIVNVLHNFEKSAVYEVVYYDGVPKSHVLDSDLKPISEAVAVNLVNWVTDTPGQLLFERRPVRLVSRKDVVLNQSKRRKPEFVSYSGSSPKPDLKANLSIIPTATSASEAFVVPISESPLTTAPVATVNSPPVNHLGTSLRSPDEVVTFEQDADGKFVCPVCSNPYISLKSVKKHVVESHAPKRYSCNMCDYVSRYQCRVSTHISTAHKNVSSVQSY